VLFQHIGTWKSLRWGRGRQGALRDARASRQGRITRAVSRASFCYRRASAAGGRIVDAVVERAFNYVCLRILGVVVKLVIFGFRWGTVATAATWAYHGSWSAVKGEERGMLAAPVGLNSTA